MYIKYWPSKKKRWTKSFPAENRLGLNRVLNQTYLELLFCETVWDSAKYCRDRIINGLDLISKWKVIVSKVSFEHAGTPDKDGMMRVLSVIQKLPPNSVYTESYLVAYSSDSESKANNCVSYLQTRFVRFLLMLMLASMNMSKTIYSFVPMQDFSKPWTDAELYARHGLTYEEITFIELMIRPME